MKKIVTIWLTGILIVFMSITGASAAWYIDDYPSSTSELTGVSFLAGNKIGYFFEKGDTIKQTFTGTGLESVVGLRLDLVLTDDTLTSFVVFNVLVNDIFVGDWVQYAIDGTGPKR